MSLITHRCTNWPTPDYWRPIRGEGRQESCDSDRCPCRRCTPGEPELAPTFGNDGRPVERVIKPGERFYPGAPTCGCNGCVALYEQLTAVSA